MNIIYQIIELINNDEWYGISEEIELVKGKNQIKKNLKARLYQMKRNFYIKNKK